MSAPRIALGIALLVGSGCILDFDRAIPCDTDENCPGAMVCDPGAGRCVSGDGDGGEDADADADAASDVVVRPDVDAADGSGADADADADVATDGSADTGDGSGGDVGPDVAPDAPADVDTDAPADVPTDIADASDAATDGSGGCVPTAELCDGFDNDCNDLIDDGIDCTAPCGPGTTVLSGPSGSFCVDLFEASRRDATTTSAGSDDSIAVSRAGVVPWGFATYAQAEAACAAASKRLCTPQEWELACGGAEAWGYPYNRSIYDVDACNGINVTPRDAAAPTASFAACTNATTGTFDMSGNLAEWASDSRTHGGDFNDPQAQLRCNGVNGDINPAVSEPAVGFRCCADLPAE